jgi:hypothetical protein
MSIRESIKRGSEDRQIFLRPKFKRWYFRRPTNNSVIIEREDDIKGKETDTCRPDRFLHMFSNWWQLCDIWSYLLCSPFWRLVHSPTLYTLLYVFFGVIPRRLNFVCRRFGTLCLFHLRRHLPAYEDGTDRVFRNVGIQNSDARELPRRKHTTYRTWRKFIHIVMDCFSSHSLNF